MNKGLKSYTKQLNLSVGGINTSTNLYSGDANFIFTLPILTTVGMAPISVGLIFNKQNEDEIGMFGKGMKLNYQKKLEYINNTTINITNADGTVDVYTLNEETGDYYNLETGLKLEHWSDYDEETSDTTDYFKLLDDKTNGLVYSTTTLHLGCEYPSVISPKNKEYVYIEEGTTFIISNGYNDVVRFEKNTGGLVETITWTKNNNEMLKAYLTYTNSYLTKVVVKKGEAVLSEYSVEYLTDKIIIKDVFSKDMATFNLNGNDVYLISYGKIGGTNIQTINIAKQNNRTVVTNDREVEITYVFDNDGILRFTKDDKGNITSYQYDKLTKNLLGVNPLPKTDVSNNLFNDSNIFNISVSGITVTESIETDDYYTALAGRNVKVLSGGGYYSLLISCSFTTTDVITAVVWVKQHGGNSGHITLSSDGNGYTTAYLNKESADNEYHPVVLGLACKNSNGYITLTIQADTKVTIGKIEIYKRGFGAFYQYDESNNIISLNENGNVTNYGYEDGYVNKQTSSTNSSVLITRDERGRVVKKVGAYQVTQEVTYDTKNRVTKEKIENFNKDMIFETKASYDDNLLKTTLLDELENSLEITKDNYGNILKSLNALGETNNKEYNDELELIKQYLSLENDDKAIQEVNYTYYEENKLMKKVILKNGTYYEFYYDENHNLTKLTLGGNQILEMRYDEYNNVSHITYGQAGTDIYYDYNKYDQVVALTIVTVNDMKIYNYLYNDNYQLICVKLNNETIKEISYNLNGQIFEIVEGNNRTRYFYDNLGNINKEEKTVEGKTYYTLYDPLYRSNGCNPESLVEKFNNSLEMLSCLFINNDINLRGYDKEVPGMINGSVSTTTTTRNKVVPCLLVSSTKKLSYSTVETKTSGNFVFWFRPNYLTTGEIILKIENEESTRYIEVYVNENHNLCIGMKDSSNDYSTIKTTSNKLEVGKWTFINLNWISDDTKTSFVVMVDGQIISFEVAKTITLLNPTYHVGYESSGYVSAVMMNHTGLLPIEMIYRYYRTTKDYIFEHNEYIDGVDNSLSTHLEKLSQYQMFPLNQDVKEISNEKTYNIVSFEPREVLVNDKDRYFNYNNKSKRYAYVADGGKLVYNVDNAESHTIGMKIYLDSIGNKKQYLFELAGYNDGVNIGLYVNDERNLCLTLEKQLVKTNIYIPLKEWVFVGLSYEQAVSIGSLATVDYQFKIVVNDSSYSVVLSSYNELTGAHLSLGRRYSKEETTTVFGSYETSYPLMGQIEMLCLSEEANSVNKLQSLKNTLKTITTTTGYNEFGMYESSAIKNDDNEIIKKKVEYKSRTDSKYKSSIIKSETIYLNNQTITREYTTDSLGRVTKITDSVFGDKNYTYNNKGYLSEDVIDSYSYDENGNIIIDGDVVVYSQADGRLLSVNGSEITYDENNIFMPTSYNGMTFTWDGKRLKQIVKNNNTINFDYNEQGLRTKKFTPSVDKEYYYNGNKLITEICDYYRLDFLYDENDMLFGFIYNNTDKYYYVRDILQNILGIVDESGTLVVKYDCNEWGKPINGTNNNGITLDTTSNNIGMINPFRYKGYYYDETGLFYCNSRYYSPELCRFISPDSIEYLVPQSINGCNLYTYCSNDPVNMYDPSGNLALPVWLEFLMSIASPAGLVFVGANKAYESAKTLNKSGWETFWWTLSGLLIGNFGVVAANWDEVEKNSHYSIYTSLIYSTYMYKEYYKNDYSRTVPGINVELFLHYILYGVGNEHGTNGADIQKFELTLEGINKEVDAVLCEILGFLVSPAAYMFRLGVYLYEKIL